MERGQRTAVKTAKSFYAGPHVSDLRCVVTDKERPHWHHLDEVQPRWWQYTNIVPLDAGLNEALDKRKHRGLPFDLQPGVLEAKGLNHYRNGRFAQGYACDRLGSYLMCPPRGDVPLGEALNPSRSLEFAAYALLQLSATSALSLAIDTVDRSILRILNIPCRVSIRSATRVLIEIESFCRNFGALNEALRCCNLSDRLLSFDGSSAPDKARLTQHKGIILAAIGDKHAAKRAYDEARRQLEGDANYTDGHGNDALWRARELLHSPKPDLDLCKELLRQVDKEYQSGRLGLWAYAEAVWTRAELFHRVGDKSRAQQGDTQSTGATTSRAVIDHGRPATMGEGMAENSHFTGSQIPGNDERVRRRFYDWER
jgi:hypothetical protein